MNKFIYIPIDDCIHGGLYLLNSRNLCMGVYNAPTKGFIGIRTKFGSSFLFTEFHWDTGPPYGTAKPLFFQEQSPFDEENIAEHEVIKVTQKMIDNGQIRFASVGEEVFCDNRKLMDWLEEKEKQYNDIISKYLS